MKNLNSKSEFFEGKEFDHRTHHSMPKIKYGKRRRKRIPYKGIGNNNNEIK